MRPRLFGSLATILFTAALFAACSTDEPSTVGHKPTFGFTEQDLAQRPEQRAALADGEIEFSEYESATIAVVSCLRSSGVYVSDPVLEGGELAYEFGRTNSREEQVEAERLHDECYSEYADAIVSMYAVNRYNPDKVDTFYNAYQSCMAEAGVDVDISSGMDIQFVIAAGVDNQHFACTAHAEEVVTEKFGLYP